MDIIVVGGFSEVFEVLEDNDYQIIGYMDLSENNKYNNYKWLGTDATAGDIKENYPKAEIVITPDQPNVREKLTAYYKKLNFATNTFVSKSATVSKSVILKKGVFIQKLAHISSNSIIGEMVKINVGANIMHDCFIGDFTTIAPNAVLLGNVTIGTHCYIGANSTILPNVQIPDGVVIGAGAVVTKTISKKGTYIGIPAKQL
jgi:UDP-N-acetylbacillosamine N-acetyltransferase